MKIGVDTSENESPKGLILISYYHTTEFLRADLLLCRGGVSLRNLPHREAAEQVRLLDRIVEEIGGRIGEFQADARVDEVPLSSAA